MTDDIDIKQVSLSQTDRLLLSAAVSASSLCSGTPKIFDVIQLDTTMQDKYKNSFAAAMLVILDHQSEWLDLINRLKASEES